MDCGAACLAMICKHYGIAMTLGKLRELANVTTQGATLESLARTGESLGFTTRGVQCTIDTLRGFELPLHRALGWATTTSWCTACRSGTCGWPTPRSASRR